MTTCTIISIIAVLIFLFIGLMSYGRNDTVYGISLFGTFTSLILTVVFGIIDDNAKHAMRAEMLNYEKYQLYHWTFIEDTKYDEIKIYESRENRIIGHVDDEHYPSLDYIIKYANSNITSEEDAYRWIENDLNIEY